MYTERCYNATFILIYSSSHASPPPFLFLLLPLKRYSKIRRLLASHFLFCLLYYLLPTLNCILLILLDLTTAIICATSWEYFSPSKLWYSQHAYEMLKFVPKLPPTYFHTILGTLPESFGPICNTFNLYDIGCKYVQTTPSCWLGGMSNISWSTSPQSNAQSKQFLSHFAHAIILLAGSQI